MEKEIPEGWVETELSSILKLKNGFAFKSNKYKEEGIPVIRISDIQDGNIILDKAVCVDEFDKENDFIVENGDILIAMSGATTGKFGIYNGHNKAYQNQRVGNLKPLNTQTSKKFIYYLIGNLRKEIEDKAYGGAQPNISAKLIEEIKINLPPLPAQERIVAKLDSIFAHLEMAKQGLEKIPVLLKEFRQAVLTQAVTGKLTEGKDWKLKTIESITTKVGSGSTPSGGQTAYQTSGIPLVRSMNIHFGGIKNEGLAFLNDKQAYELRNVTIEKNDVLLNITGASIGRVCLAEDHIIGGRVNQHVSIVRANHIIVSPQFLNIAMSSPIVQNYINDENYGVTRQALTKGQLLNLEILLPPIEEQNEIVRRVDALFSKADAIEAQYKKLKVQINQLPQAILAKAFRGEV
ncbi:MAG: restriction endonuclease subunit S [Moraxellaceae bacterium]